jgi:hypothetical protein
MESPVRKLARSYIYLDDIKFIIDKRISKPQDMQVARHLWLPNVFDRIKNEIFNSIRG